MNRNKIRLALGSFIIASSTHAAAYDLSGQVTNISGSPIEGAKVTLSVAAATGQISGRVTDSATGNGIAGAQVFIDIKPEIGAQSPAIGLTDANGYYTLPELEEGKWIINGKWNGSVLPLGVLSNGSFSENRKVIVDYMSRSVNWFVSHW